MRDGIRLDMGGLNLESFIAVEEENHESFYGLTAAGIVALGLITADLCA